MEATPVFFYLVMWVGLFFYLNIVLPSSSLVSAPVRNGGSIRLHAVLFVALGMIAVVELRWVLLDGGALAMDEGSYIMFLSHPERYRNFPVSGPLYLWIHHHLSDFFRLPPVEIIPRTAAVLAPVAMAAVVWMYHVSCAMPRHQVMTGASLLFLTHHFFWTVLEGRPQQLGFIVTFGLILLFDVIRRSGSHRARMVLYAGFTGLLFYHILSAFFLFSALFLIWLSWPRCSRRIIRATLLDLAVLAGIMVMGMFGPQTPYRAMVSDLHQFHLKGVDPAVIMIGLFVVAVLLVFMRPFLARMACWGLAGIRSPWAMPFLLLLAGAAAVGQFIMQAQVIGSFYHQSLWMLIGFQAGNILFLLFYLVGLSRMVRAGEHHNPFVSASLALALIGLGLLLASLFLGHKNGALRAINYWTIPAAPVAAMALINLKKWLRRLLLFLLPSLMAATILLATKDPRLFHFHYFWTAGEIHATEQACRDSSRVVMSTHPDKLVVMNKLVGVLCPDVQNRIFFLPSP